MRGSYDVIIVGAGPGGTLLAHKLAAAGLSTLILEKYVFPRYKPCGGLVSHKAFKLLPQNWENNTEDKIYKILFSYQNNPLEVKFDSPIIHTVMRGAFDDFLLSTAIDSGAYVSMPERVVNIEFTKDEFFVKTNKNAYQSRYLVGADGPTSVVRRSFSYGIDIRFAKTVEAEIEVDQQTLKEYRGRIWIEHSNIKNGYSWIFPKRNHLSIGTGTTSKIESNSLTRKLNDFLLWKEITPTEGFKKFGYIVPYLQSFNNQFHWEKSLLIGDAAGLPDPLTGEGIFNALYSAKIASKAIIDAAEDNSTLDNYSTYLYQTIIPELDTARKISKIAYSLPAKTFETISKKPQLVKKLFEAVCGEYGYSELYGYLTGGLRFS